ncbi:hypothetical protein DL768_000602 [Monosporascus sp. mg162]|nr:hypothetical protein DL768_000602 [Monosporascus sp. mg162]
MESSAFRNLREKAPRDRHEAVAIANARATDLGSLVAAGTAEALGEACARLGVEQSEEDADLSDEEDDEYHGDDDGTEDSEGSEKTDPE